MARLVHLNINLLQPKNQVQVSKMWCLVLLVLVLTATLFSYYFLRQSREIKGQQAENMRLKAEIISYENEIAVFEPIQNMEQEISVKSEVVTGLEKTKVSYAGVINELDRVKPTQIIIVAEEINPTRVVVNGFSPDHSNVSLMVEGIKSSPVFTKVALLASDMNETTNEVQFTLELEWGADHK